MSDRTTAIPKSATKFDSYAEATSLQLTLEHNTGEIHDVIAVYQVHDSRQLDPQPKVWVNPSNTLATKLTNEGAEWYLVPMQDRQAFISTILENPV